jgi:MtN3 and saliva related transmembrane protein
VVQKPQTTNSSYLCTPHLPPEFLFMQDTIVQIIGIVAGILTSSSFIPQLVKIIKTKKAEDVSAFMLYTRELGLGLWIWYGILQQDLPVIITFAFAFIINTAVIFFKVKYSGVFN